MTDQVAKAIAKLEQFMATVDDALAIPREAGQFVHALVLAGGAKNAVEIGTSYGYSGLWIASALAEVEGSLITIDRDPRKSAAARENFREAGLAGAIDVRTGSAAEVLPSIEGPIDFVLNDADKESCLRYVELLADRLSDRAVVVTDNITTHAAELATFLAEMRRRDDFHTVSVPIGNGMELSVKTRGVAG